MQVLGKWKSVSHGVISDTCNKLLQACYRLKITSCINNRPVEIHCMLCTCSEMAITNIMRRRPKLLYSLQQKLPAAQVSKYTDIFLTLRNVKKAFIEYSSTVPLPQIPEISLSSSTKYEQYLAFMLVYT